MRLATEETGGDGRLYLVSRDGEFCKPAAAASTLLDALMDWKAVSGGLASEAAMLEAGNGEPAADRVWAAPLPRSWQFLDASAFLAHNHILADAWDYEKRSPDEPPLMYQGLSNHFYGPSETVPFRSEDDLIDFEAEFAVIVDHVPAGTGADRALDHVALVLLLNDWSLRAFGPSEQKGGFGFIQAKPPSSLAPFAVTPDELGDSWRDGRVHMNATIWRGEDRFGYPSGSEMTYDFAQLIAHAALTRDLVAGTLIGSGTVSNANAQIVGSACIAERRALDVLAGIEPTRFLSFGEQVTIEAHDSEGWSPFGAIKQSITQRSPLIA